MGTVSGLMGRGTTAARLVSVGMKRDAETCTRVVATGLSLRPPRIEPVRVRVPARIQSPCPDEGAQREQDAVRRDFRGLMAAVLGVLFLAMMVPVPASAEPLYPWPDPDPFYLALADLGATAPGDVVRTRRIDTWMYANSDGWQVAFRSTNSVGNPILAVTTVLLPTST